MEHFNGKKGYVAVLYGCFFVSAGMTSSILVNHAHLKLLRENDISQMVKTHFLASVVIAVIVALFGGSVISHMNVESYFGAFLVCFIALVPMLELATSLLLLKGKNTLNLLATALIGALTIVGLKVGGGGARTEERQFQAFVMLGSLVLMRGSLLLLSK